MLDPIHLQDLFSKTQLAEKITQVQKQHPEMEQRFFNAQLQQKIENDRTQARSLEPKDEMIIHQEEKRNSEENSQQEKRKEESPEEENTTQEPPKDKSSSERHIDIRI